MVPKKWNLVNWLNGLGDAGKGVYDMYAGELYTVLCGVTTSNAKGRLKKM